MTSPHFRLFPAANAPGRQPAGRRTAASHQCRLFADRRGTRPAQKHAQKRIDQSGSGRIPEMYRGSVQPVPHKHDTADLAPASTAGDMWSRIPRWRRHQLREPNRSRTTRTWGAAKSSNKSDPKSASFPQHVARSSGVKYVDVNQSHWRWVVDCGTGFLMYVTEGNRLVMVMALLEHFCTELIEPP